jgi:hypothetical protein
MKRFSDSMEYLTLLSILTTSTCCEAVNAHNFRWLIDSAFAASFGFKSSGGETGVGRALLTRHRLSTAMGVNRIQFVTNQRDRRASIES